VDVDLTSDQELLLQTTSRFIESACPLTAVRALAEDGKDAGPDYRRQGAELGWFAFLVPEDLGGGNVSGNGVMDAAIVAQARGAQLQPGPFVGTNVVALALAAAGAHSEVLDALVAGEASASWAAAGPDGDWTAAAGVEATAKGDGFVLTGGKSAVQDADRVGWLLVTASTPDGPAQFLLTPDTTGVSARRLDGLDLTRAFCTVGFDDVEVPASALVGPAGDVAAIERQLDVACVLTAAESIGAMDRDFNVALDYAKARTAFGRPIGSFQAIKHLLADTSLELEMSKAIAQAAAEAVGEGRKDGTSLASMAKAFVGDCGIDLAQNCFQVFGGIGYTWEHDQHLYLRRLTADASLYGDPAWHRERVCRLGGF
jgi:alkylation response protein AidB-like acyl-CoA dehydrogenase